MSSDNQLNSNRIRQMATLRRSAYRSRSYCMVALGGCVVGAAECIFYGVRRWIDQPTLYGILIALGYFLAAIGLLFLAGHFGHIARRFHHEANKSALESPIQPPDFSQLQDGSQTVRNLEEMEP